MDHTSQLLEFIRTQTDVQLLLEEINLLEKSFYSSEDGLTEKVLEKEIRYEIAQILRQHLVTDEGSRQTYIDEIKQTVKNLKSIRITLGFRPSYDFVLRMSNWVRINVDPQVIIQLRFSQAILGGAMVEYEGKFGDFSLASKIDKLFADPDKRFSRLLELEPTDQ